jgi:hypothetical protein
LEVNYGGGHDAGWIPSQEEFLRFDAACKESAGKVLDEARVIAEQSRISAELLHVSNAYPAAAIIETAKSRGCDLIVMASHGDAARTFIPVRRGRAWAYQVTNKTRFVVGAAEGSWWDVRIGTVVQVRWHRAASQPVADIVGIRARSAN